MINYSKRSLILSILSNTDELIFLLECFENYLKLIFLKVFFFLQCKILDNIYTYNLRIIPYSMYPDDCVVLIMIIYLLFFSLPDFLFIFYEIAITNNYYSMFLQKSNNKTCMFSVSQLKRHNYCCCYCYYYLF